MNRLEKIIDYIQNDFQDFEISINDSYEMNDDSSDYEEVEIDANWNCIICTTLNKSKNSECY